MAYTTADLALIDQAIATGATRVRFADNRETVFRSLADLRSIRQEIAEAVGAVPQPDRPRVTYAEYCRD